MRTCTKCGTLLAASDPIPVSPVSPVPMLVNTNAVPTSIEEGAIRANLLDMNSELLQLRNEIDRVQAVLNGLQRKRKVLSDAFHQYSRQHNPLLSSIRRLPHEMLSEIFLFSIPNGERTKDRREHRNWKRECYDLRRAVMRLMSCRRWRDVALSTPRLWSSINLFFHGTTGKAELDLMRMANVLRQSTSFHWPALWVDAS